jgi:RNA polymerase sigma factor (sigma-70 family)
MVDENEIELIIAAQKGDKASMEILVDRHRYWAYKFILPYPWVFHDDLRQQAMLGLLEAIKRFDTTTTFRLRTFAIHRIKMQILNFLYQRSGVLNCSPKTRHMILSEERHILDPLYDTVGPILPSVERQIMTKQLMVKIENALQELTERERDILRLHIMETELTLEQISKQFNVTRERIRQIEELALNKLKIKLKTVRSFLAVLS